jgi:transcription antitermination factor NusG
MNKQQNDGQRNWYAIHTYAGYENAVARNLKQRIESLGMENNIFNVIVPTEKKIKIKAGKRVEEEEKIYPGYVLVEMIVTDDSWFVVRNTPRVTGFVGSGVVPVPLEKKEVDLLFSRMNICTEKSSEFRKFWNCRMIAFCSSEDFKAKFKEEARIIDLIDPSLSITIPSRISCIGTNSCVVFADFAIIIFDFYLYTYSL